MNIYIWLQVQGCDISLTWEILWMCVANAIISFYGGYKVVYERVSSGASILHHGLQVLYQLLI